MLLTAEAENMPWEWCVQPQNISIRALTRTEMRR